MALVQRIKSSSDKKFMIPSSLVHSSGTITASFPTNTTVGGSYSAVLSGLVANGTYFLYIRNSGITPSLFFVTTTPAAYRVLFPDAILVGAFIASDVAVFGSFINIEGTPMTQTALTWLPSSTGFGTLSGQACSYTRNGKFLYADIRFATGTVVGSTARVGLPVNLSADTAYLASTTHWLSTCLNNSSVNFTNAVILTSDSLTNILFNSSTALSATGLLGNTSPFASGQLQSMQVRIPISAWSTTPLKDL